MAQTIADHPGVEKQRQLPAELERGVCLLTGGFDRPYAFGLAMALAGRNMPVEVLGNSEVDSPEMHSTPQITFLDFYWDPHSKAGLLGKTAKLAGFYLRLLRHVPATKARILHILWNNKIPVFDRTLLMWFYKLAGKKVVLTAHNVNAGKRDGNDSFLNRLTLKIQYKLADHIFVHTERMKRELIEDFGIDDAAVTIIPFGINNSLPETDLTPAEARKKLGIGEREKAILFFGAIRQYKGVEFLVEAFIRLAKGSSDYRLILAGEPKKGTEEYVQGLRQAIVGAGVSAQVIEKFVFVPDEETELYFKAADVSILPYTLVFQSGVLFLAYNFGLPVIASNVGSFEEDITEGRNGLLFQSQDSADLARAIEQYFGSDLYRNLDQQRTAIRDAAVAHHSWDTVSKMTEEVYTNLLRAGQQ